MLFPGIEGTYGQLTFSVDNLDLKPPYYLMNGFSAEFRFTGSVPGRDDLCRAQGEFLFVQPWN